MTTTATARPTEHNHVFYGDGNPARVGHRVRAGRDRVEGIVIWFTPANSTVIAPYLHVVDDDGRLWKKTLSTTVLLGPTIHPFPKEAKWGNGATRGATTTHKLRPRKPTPPPPPPLTLADAVLAIWQRDGWPASTLEERELRRLLAEIRPRSRSEWIENEA